MQCNVEKFIKCAMYPWHAKERKGFADFVKNTTHTFLVILPQCCFISLLVGVVGHWLIALYKKTDQLSMTTCHDIWSRNVSDDYKAWMDGEIQEISAKDLH